MGLFDSLANAGRDSIKKHKTAYDKWLKSLEEKNENFVPKNKKMKKTEVRKKGGLDV